MSKPIIITAQPDDQYFIWQNHLYIESCIERGFTEDQIHILLYKPTSRIPNTNWNKLKEIYPKLNIFLYEDKGVQQYLSTYIPIIRPHILWQHFKKFPELQDRTIIYTDADILWTKNLDIKELLEDGNCYVSNASSYLNYDYLLNKINNAIPEKRDRLIELDYIQGMCDIIDINKEIVQNNNHNTGGVQYILKNINWELWKKVEEDVLKIRKYLLNINREFFKDENSGIQSWCSDLWTLQWNLWKYNYNTEVTKKLDFAWASEPIEKLNSCMIYHNAGVTGKYMNNIPYFYKGAYHTGQNPLLDEHLETVINNEQSKKYCTWYYTNKLLELKNKYNINY